MSQQGFPGLGNQSPQQQGVAVEKPKSDVYTVMLLIALLAIGAAIALLASELDKYNWITNPAPPPPKAPARTSLLESSQSVVRLATVDEISEHGSS